LKWQFNPQIHTDLQRIAGFEPAIHQVNYNQVVNFTSCSARFRVKLLF